MIGQLALQQAAVGLMPLVQLDALEAPARFTGAIIVGNSLFVATVERKHGRLRLVRRSTERFSLEERNQDAIRELHSSIHEFFDERMIERVLLRFAPSDGPYKAHAFVYLLETMVHLIPGVDVELAHPATIAAWLRQTEEDLPSPPVCDRKKIADNFAKAIEVACAAASNDRRR